MPTNTPLSTDPHADLPTHLDDLDGFDGSPHHDSSDPNDAQGISPSDGLCGLILDLWSPSAYTLSDAELERYASASTMAQVLASNASQVFDGMAALLAGSRRTTAQGYPGGFPDHDDWVAWFSLAGDLFAVMAAMTRIGADASFLRQHPEVRRAASRD